MDYEEFKKRYYNEPLVFVKDTKLQELTLKILKNRSDQIIDEETLRYNRNLSILLPMVVGAENEEVLKN